MRYGPFWFNLATIKTVFTHIYLCSSICSCRTPVGVNTDSDLCQSENGNSVPINFDNLDRTLGSLMPGGSLSVYLKDSIIWEQILRKLSF